MVQLSTPGVTPNRGMPPVRRFLSNYFDLLFMILGDNVPVISNKVDHSESGAMHIILRPAPYCRVLPPG